MFARMLAVITLAVPLAPTTANSNETEKRPPLGFNFAWSSKNWPRQDPADLADVELSQNGYPMVQFLAKGPLCMYMRDVREAKEAWRAKDMAWLEKIPGCVLIDKPLVVEWTREEVVTGIVELRFPSKGGRPITVYAPLDHEMWGWFWFVRKKTNETKEAKATETPTSESPSPEVKEGQPETPQCVAGC
jgi:hypothetical protein